MVTQKAELLQKAWPRWLEPNQQLSCFLTWSQSFFTISSIVVQFLKHQPLEYLQESFAEFMPFQGESRAKASEWAIRNLKTRDRNNTSHHSQWIFFLKNNYIHCIMIRKNKWFSVIRNPGIKVDSRYWIGHFDAIWKKNYISTEDKKYYFTTNTNFYFYVFWCWFIWRIPAVFGIILQNQNKWKKEVEWSSIQNCFIFDLETLQDKQSK